jgi:hypothetical protein
MKRLTVIVATVTACMALLAGCDAAHPVEHAASKSASGPASSPPAAAPSPSPNGTYQGSCNYDLGSNPAGGTAVATGDVEVTNTGNVGTVLQVQITWPQEGYAPLSMIKTVKVATGVTKDVPFHMPLTEDQLSNLQNWQLGHDDDDGCTYKSTIINVFGPAS